MLKLKKSDIFEQINRDLADPDSSVCRLIVSFLVSSEAKTLRHITHKTLVIGAGLDVSTPEGQIPFIKATDYLSSHRLHLLEMHFQFIDGSSDEPLDIDNDIVSYALHSGCFYHPDTGALVEEFNKYLFPYFSPTEMLDMLHG